MTDLSPVKAMLVSALTAATIIKDRQPKVGTRLSGEDFSGEDFIGVGDPYLYQGFFLDCLAATVTAHFLDREKVRSALTDIITGIEIDTDHGAIGQLGGRRAYYRYAPGLMRPDIRIEDDLIDRLIAALRDGGRSE